MGNYYLYYYTAAFAVISYISLEITILELISFICLLILGLFWLFLDLFWFFLLEYSACDIQNIQSWVSFGYLFCCIVFILTFVIFFFIFTVKLCNSVFFSSSSTISSTWCVSVSSFSFSSIPLSSTCKCFLHQQLVFRYYRHV